MRSSFRRCACGHTPLSHIDAAIHASTTCPLLDDAEGRPRQSVPAAGAGLPSTAAGPVAGVAASKPATPGRRSPIWGARQLDGAPGTPVIN